MKFDGGTKGKTTHETPSNTQQTTLLQTNFDGPQKAQEFLFPKNTATSVNSGEKAVSSFPVKY